MTDRIPTRNAAASDPAVPAARARLGQGLRIGTRIGAGFMAVIILMIVILVLSVLRLTELRAESRDLATIMLPSRQALFRMMLAIDAAAEDQANCLLYGLGDWSADRDRQWQRIAAERRRFDLELPRYGSPEFLATWAHTKQALDAWKVAQDSLEQKMREGLGASTAAKLLQEDVAPRRALLRDTIDGPADAAGERHGGFNEPLTKLVNSTFSAINDEISATIAVITATGALAILLAAVASIWAARSVTWPLGRTTAAMRELAEGADNVDIPGLARADEIGAISRALLVFKENKAAKDALARQSAIEQAGKEARVRQIEVANARFDESASRSLSVLIGAAENLHETAQGMAASAATANRQATEVAAASDRASVNVQTVAAATEELTAAVGEISRQVQQSTSIAREAVNDIAQSRTTVSALAEAAERIGEVVELINSIASQTNLLALNATIEAARAGEAGKGFAVVANEVKALANQTARATQDIAQQVGAIQASAGNAVAAIARIGGTIDRMNGISSAIVLSVDQQSASTREIAQNVADAAQGTGTVVHNIVDVISASDEAGAASRLVLAAAGALRQQADVIRGDVDAFLGEVRSA